MTLLIKAFQFHSGSIKTVKFDSEFPIKALFQFHSGSIKTTNVDKDSQFTIKFQFHSGSIKTKGNYWNLSNKSVSIPLWFD